MNEDRIGINAVRGFGPDGQHERATIADDAAAVPKKGGLEELERRIGASHDPPDPVAPAHGDVTLAFIAFYHDAPFVVDKFYLQAMLCGSRLFLRLRVLSYTKAEGRKQQMVAMATLRWSAW